MTDSDPEVSPCTSPPSATTFRLHGKGAEKGLLLSTPCTPALESATPVASETTAAAPILSLVEAPAPDLLSSPLDAPHSPGFLSMPLLLLPGTIIPITGAGHKDLHDEQAARKAPDDICRQEGHRLPPVRVLGTAAGCPIPAGGTPPPPIRHFREQSSQRGGVPVTETGSSCPNGHSHSPLARIPVTVCPYCSLDDIRRHRSPVRARSGAYRTKQIQLAIWPWRATYLQTLRLDGMSVEDAVRECDRAATIVHTRAVRDEYLDVFRGFQGQIRLQKIEWEVEQEIMERTRQFLVLVRPTSHSVQDRFLDSRDELLNIRLCQEIRSALTGNSLPDDHSEEA